MCLPALNLLNFELPSANKCKYVLTSPRSLKACRRAGVKPIDLLYKSLSDVENEIGSKEKAQVIFEAYEMERQRKLALCRALRNELLLHGQWGFMESSNKLEKHKRCSPKLRNSKENALPAISGSYYIRRAETPENMRHTRDQSTTPRSLINLPKVNMVFDNMKEDSIKENKTNKSISKTCDKVADSKVNSVKNVEPDNSKFRIRMSEVENKLESIEEGLQKINKGKSDLCVPHCIEGTDESNFLEGIDFQRNSGPEQLNNFKNKVVQDDSCIASEDMNNNHVKVKIKRPNSAIRRKARENKKHLRGIDVKKTFQRMKIEYSDPEYCIYKYKQVIENSVERDLRELEVQKVQRELEVGMEKWQDRVLLLQWLDMARAQEQAARELEIKVERLQQKNRTKNIIHTMNINKVKEAEDMKAEGLRRQVQKKERKIFSLHQEKERIIGESKSRALSVQELKEQIRNIMTPETFDQKVAKLSIHKKVLDSQMCARIMQRSHIWLG